MTQELGPAARALLDAAREGLGPDAAAVRRMRGKIEVAVGVGAGAGAGIGALLAKVGVGAIVVALVAGAVVYGRRRDDAVAPRIELPTRRAETAAPPSREVAPPPAEEGEGEGEGEIEIEMAPVVTDRSRGAAAVTATVVVPVVPAAVPGPAPAAGVAPAPAPAPPKRADLAREVELVDQAMAALRRADLSAALAAARAHGNETAGAGQLAEDAAAIEIEALCRLHDPAAGAKLAAFDARWPESAQRSRLSTRCP